MTDNNSTEPEWYWCLVGNIVKTRTLGENKSIINGTKMFVSGTKVFMAPPQWGDGYESIVVIGNGRYGHGYITAVLFRKYIENLRVQKVYRPAVIKLMRSSDYEWWGNTDVTHDRIVEFINDLYGE